MSAWSLSPGLLNPLRAAEIRGLLLTAGSLLSVWCVGRLRRRRFPPPPGVGTITEIAFASLLQQQGRERYIAATAFRYLREVQKLQVPVLPGDHLIWDLRMTEAEVEETLIDLARRLNRDQATISARRLPDTVEDLVADLQNLPIVASQSAVQAA